MSDVVPVEVSSHEARLARIREHQEEFEAAGERSETMRFLPAETAEILRELGVFWFKTPRVLGGDPLPAEEFGDVIEELGYIDASVAWAAMIGAGTTGLAACWLNDAGAATLFAPGRPLPVVAGQPRQPGGRGRRVDGGWTVTGRWGFASGISHASWVTGAFLPDGGDGPLRAFVVPKDRVEVIDTWEVAGLRGTGSFDFALQDVHIRDDWLYTPTAPALRVGPLSHDARAFVSNEVPPVAVGVARRALDCMIGVASTTTRTVGVGRLSERASFHKELGQAAARIRAARAAHREAVRAATAVAGSADDRDREHAVLELFTASVFTVETCTAVVVDLFRYGGGRALALRHPMQRYLRDLLAARQHVALSEEMYELDGRFLLESHALSSSGAAPAPSPKPKARGRRSRSRTSNDGGQSARS